MHGRCMNCLTLSHQCAAQRFSLIAHISRLIAHFAGSTETIPPRAFTCKFQRLPGV
jgi:hypothetical protein